MIYAEKIVVDEIQKGVFMSLSEFLPYRAEGWIATDQYNALADKRLEELAHTSEAVLKYMAPMIRLGEDYRFEIHRRLNA